MILAKIGLAKISLVKIRSSKILAKMPAKIRISKVKSILIVLLASLAVYQTGILWFVNITSHNFLANYFPFLHQEAIPEGADRLVVPRRIIISAPENGGNLTFAARYTITSDIRRYGDIVLSHLLQSGTFVSVTEPDAETLHYILSGPGYIYEYAFPMDPEWFTRGFGQRSNILTARGSGMEPFRQVIIRPAAIVNGTNAHIFFISENGLVYEFTVPDPSDHIMPTVVEGPFYRLENGRFYRYNSPFYGINLTNPYADAVGVSLSHIKDQVSMFFSNPTAVRPIVGNDVWVFMDINTVVRYYVTHVLEYISYRAIDRSAPSSFINDFAVALQFTDRDHLVVNDFYLANFREENGQHIFYFNYIVDETPLPLPSHPIVVTVDHGTVVRYRKLAFNFHTDSQSQTYSQEEFAELLERLIYS